MKIPLYAACEPDPILLTKLNVAVFPLRRPLKRSACSGAGCEKAQAAGGGVIVPEALVPKSSSPGFSRFLSMLLTKARAGLLVGSVGV